MRSNEIHFDSTRSGRKRLILGCALTGAKFTPRNHYPTEDATFDTICRGDRIPIAFDEVERETQALYQGGCRYLHIHARNPVTHEQSCDNSIYVAYNQRLAPTFPDLILSYGASRNGIEIDEAIRRNGEWARVSQAALSVEEGGAHFVTIQAAVELQIVKDLERRGYLRIEDKTGQFEWLKPMRDYTPSREIEDVSIPVYSTVGGKNYGASSAWIQYCSLSDAVRSRCDLGLPQEVEWVQFARSHVMTRVACTAMKPGLLATGRLNVTLLFGFSPKMPFPLTYCEFQRVVTAARSLESVDVGDTPVRLSISVGAAVLPQHAKRHMAPLDVGAHAGRIVSPLERIVAYASQPDSRVDMIRFGMEDTPYLIDTSGTLRVADNLMLLEAVLGEIDANGAEIVTEGHIIREFRSCPSMRQHKAVA
jgi:hypothetical protein